MPIGSWLFPVKSLSASLHFNKGKTVEVLLDVVKVEARANYELFLVFENGEKRIFDMTPYMNKLPFSRLKGSALFRLAKIDYGTVVWPGNIDIAPETLYDRSRSAG